MTAPHTSDSLLLITGASGYVGRRLSAMALQRGHRVRAAVREGSTAPGGVETRHFDLAGDEDLTELLRGVDRIVHLAAILDGGNRRAGLDEELNVRGSRRLLEAARRSGVRRFVFLSSQSASADSPTDYGRSKAAIEAMLERDGECAVRTGLVSGGAPRGLYGALCRITRRLPWIPMLRGSAPIYPLHIDDLCAGLLSIVEQRTAPTRLLRICADRPMRFDAYVRLIGLARNGRRVRLLPIPSPAVAALAAGAAALSLISPGTKERILGLLALRPMDCETIPTPAEAPTPIDLPRRLMAEGLRRRLLIEGRVLTRYLGCGSPGMLRRYARAVELECDREPLRLPAAWLRTRPLLALVEPISHEGRWARRLSIATRVVETVPASAGIFHRYEAGSRLGTLLRLGWIVALEALRRPLRALLGGRRE